MQRMEEIIKNILVYDLVEKCIKTKPIIEYIIAIGTLANFEHAKIYVNIMKNIKEKV